MGAGTHLARTHRNHRPASPACCPAPASATIPQVFVGGEHIGGCTETLDAFNDGRLQELLSKSGVAFRPMDVNAYSDLPKWVHPR